MRRDVRRRAPPIAGELVGRGRHGTPRSKRSAPRATAWRPRPSHRPGRAASSPMAPPRINKLLVALGIVVGDLRGGDRVLGIGEHRHAREQVPHASRRGSLQGDLGELVLGDADDRPARRISRARRSVISATVMPCSGRPRRHQSLAKIWPSSSTTSLSGLYPLRHSKFGASGSPLAPAHCRPVVAPGRLGSVPGSRQDRPEGLPPTIRFVPRLRQDLRPGCSGAPTVSDRFRAALRRPAIPASRAGNLAYSAQLSAPASQSTVTPGPMVEDSDIFFR